MTAASDITSLRVLVPVDGSPLSDGVIPHVRRLVHHERERAEVHLLRVLSGGAPSEMERVAEAASARVHLEALTRQLAGSCARVVSHVVEGDPRAQILEAARASKVDLVAMTTHGRTGLARVARGSVAEGVLLECDAPVFLVNPHVPAPLDGAEVRYRRVVVPLDGSAGSAEVLAVAGSIALGSGAQVVLMNVTEALPHGLTPDARAAGLLGSARRSLEAAGLTDVRIVGRAGDPAARILDEVGVQHGDLLAMSTHARTGIARLRYGSVAQQVLRSVTCPMLAFRMRAAAG